MTPSSDRKPWSWTRFLVVVAAVAAVLAVAWRYGLFAIHDRRRLLETIDQVRDARFLAVGFVLTYAVAAAVGVPATPLTLAGGVLFGAVQGSMLNWTAELAAAMLAFGALRFTGAGGRAAISGAALLRLRLIPVVPFALINAMAAFGEMSVLSFFTATAIGIIPVTLIYTISAAQLVAGVAGSGTRALVSALVSAAVLIGVSFLPKLLARRSTEAVE